MSEHTVVVQKWEESELGWGTRPDGFSLHLNEEARSAYVREYWKKMPEYPPEEYSRPYGTPYFTTVSEETYREIEVKGGSLRRYHGPTPSGWMPV